MLGLRFCARAFSSCGKRGPLFIAVRSPLTVAASLVAEHRLQTHKLSSCGSGAQLLRGMWDLPRPGLEPVSPALAGRFSTTAPPGKPNFNILITVFQYNWLPFNPIYLILCILKHSETGASAPPTALLQDSSQKLHIASITVAELHHNHWEFRKYAFFWETEGPAKIESYISKGNGEE